MHFFYSQEFRRITAFSSEADQQFINSPLKTHGPPLVSPITSSNALLSSASSFALEYQNAFPFLKAHAHRPFVVRTDSIFSSAPYEREREEDDDDTLSASSPPIIEGESRAALSEAHRSCEGNGVQKRYPYVSGVMTESSRSPAHVQETTDRGQILHELRPQFSNSAETPRGPAGVESGGSDKIAGFGKQAFADLLAPDWFTRQAQIAQTAFACQRFSKLVKLCIYSYLNLIIK